MFSLGERFAHLRAASRHTQPSESAIFSRLWPSAMRTPNWVGAVLMGRGRCCANIKIPSGASREISASQPALVLGGHAGVRPGKIRGDHSFKSELSVTRRSHKACARTRRCQGQYWSRLSDEGVVNVPQTESHPSTRRGSGRFGRVLIGVCMPGRITSCAGAPVPVTQRHLATNDT